MATIGTGSLILNDVVSQYYDGKGGQLEVAELLKNDKPILDYIPWMECNDGSTNKSLQRTGLPTWAWRELNNGIVESKSEKAVCTDTTGIAESHSVIDEDIAEHKGKVRENRYNEDISHIESLGQGIASTLFYGNTNSDAASFLGLAPRMSDPTALNGANLFNGGGSASDNASIFLCGWGAHTGYGLYPEGSKGGIMVENKDKIARTGANGGTYWAYVTQFKWKAGLCIKDWRYFGRICNISMGALTTDVSGSSANLIDLLIQMTEEVRSSGNVKQVLVMPKKIRAWCRRQLNAKSNQYFTQETFDGKKLVTFDGIPVVADDSLLLTEDAITFA